MSSKDRDESVYPLVEIDSPGSEWSFIETSNELATANKADRLMAVPLAYGKNEHLIRTRELGRIRWSPSVIDYASIRASKECVDTVEELRIRHKLKYQAGVDITQLSGMPTELHNSLLKYYLDREIPDIRTAAVHAINAWLTEDQTEVMGKLYTLGKVGCQVACIATNTARKLQEDAGLSWNSTAQTAVYLHAWIGAAEDELMKKRKKAAKATKKNVDKNCSLNKFNANDAASEGVDKWLDKIDYSTQGKGSWGKLITRKLPFNHRLKEKNIGRRKRCTEEGVFLHQIWRISTDRQVFCTPSKRKGGSVLIDGSGSMRLSPDDIKTIMLSAPAVSIAIYAGDSATGYIKELARNGRHIDLDKITLEGCGGNVVDGPALDQWLAKQPMPRVWVSDGFVTGVGDKMGSDLLTEAVGLVRKHHIIRVDNVTEAQTLFKKLTIDCAQLHPAVRRRMQLE